MYDIRRIVRRIDYYNKKNKLKKNRQEYTRV